MNFWNIEHKYSGTVVIDHQANKSWDIAELKTSIAAIKSKFLVTKEKKLILILCKNNIPSLVGYIAALQAKQAIMLVDAEIHPSLLTALIDVYKPEQILAPASLQKIPFYKTTYSFLDYDLMQHLDPLPQDVAAINDELALLLPTSGTTGNPKFVRLSYNNLQANADSIAQYLELSAKERPITSLPIYYSFGLSVINSHLLTGATILLTNCSVAHQDFWQFANQYQTTSLAGVPYIYEILKRIRAQSIAPASLRTFTQAGGKLNAKLVEHFYELAQQHKWKFYVMYGATEATARISYVPPELLGEKLASIGRAIPGGELTLDPTTSVLIYSGPNVMLGYANSRADLNKGDELHGVLKTSDIARQDVDGFFYLEGRNERFVKLFGLRVNLDDIVEALSNKFGCPFACISDDQKIYIFVVGKIIVAEIYSFISELFGIHHSAVAVKELADMPLNSNCKTNYNALFGMIK